MHAQSCEWCATPFIAHTSKARFCSAACRSAAARVRASTPEAVAPLAADPVEPGSVRAALDRWLVSEEAERHVLAGTARSLADRVDGPGSHGLAESVDALFKVVDIITMSPSQTVEPSVQLVHSDPEGPGS